MKNIEKLQFVVLAALVACASAGIVPAAAPAAIITKVADAEYDPHPQYTYSYDVADSLTGDFKAQTETRNGDTVQGSYSLLEADGTRRIVDYAADSLNGFNAVVRKEPATFAYKALAPVAKIAAPLAYAAPAAIATPVAKVAAPLAYAAPVAKVAAAPLAYAAAPAAYAPAAYAAPLGYAAPAFAAYPAAAYATPYFAKSYY